MFISQRLHSSGTFRRKVSLISKWYCLIFVWKPYLRSLRHTLVLLLVSTRLLKQSLLPQRPIVLSLFIVNLRLYHLVILRIVRPIAHKPRRLRVRLPRNLVQHLRHLLRRLISVPNSKMCVLIVDFVQVMMRSSRSQLPCSCWIIIDGLILVFSDHSVQIVNWLPLMDELVSASTLEG